MSKRDPNKKHYFDEVPLQEMKNLMPTLIDSKAEVNIWEQGKHEDVEFYKCTSGDEEGLKLFLENQGGFLSKLTGSSLKDKDVFIKITIGKMQYFTTSLLQQDETSKDYILTFDRKVFKSQQRSNYRLMCSSSVTIQFKIDDEVFDGLDISAGGTSIEVPESEAERFAKDKEFTECQLRLNSFKTDIAQCKIAGSWVAKDSLGQPNGNIKLGIAFLNVDKKTEEKLFQEINSEARAEEMRKMMAKRAASK
ncbi:MAG: c-di-GMP-binding flagellar brake protein YcgR [Bacteriovoracaceae bacterium]|jgi:c-di-GMP-binding flagellar brake protein YcgR